MPHDFNLVSPTIQVASNSQPLGQDIQTDASSASQTLTKRTNPVATTSQQTNPNMQSNVESARVADSSNQLPATPSKSSQTVDRAPSQANDQTNTQTASIFDLVLQSFRWQGNSFQSKFGSNNLAEEDEIEGDDNDGSENIAQNALLEIELEEDVEPAPEIVWEVENLFANENAFEQFLKEGNCWSKLNTVVTANGRKNVYRCNRFKRRGRQCTAGIYTVTGQGGIRLFRKNLPHNHETNQNRTVSLSDDTKTKIIDLYRSHNKPKTISYILGRDENIQEVSMTQINNTIAQYRKQAFGGKSITLNELSEFIHSKMVVPVDMDEAFVVTFERSPNNDPEENVWFRYVVSTKRLLQLATTTDMGGHFHLFGLMLTSNETTQDYEFLFNSIVEGVQLIHNHHLQNQIKTLIADGALKIKNGFDLVFDPNETTAERLCRKHD